jgi:hypothetical protein
LNNSTPSSKDQAGGAETTAPAPQWIVHPKYCPNCGYGQPLSESCEYCGIPFTPLAADESDAGPGNDSLSSPDKALPVIPGRMSPRFRVIALALLFVSIVSLVAGITRYRSHSQSQFFRNYVLALYGLNSGMEMTGRVSEGKYRAWKEGVTSFVPESSGIDSDTLADLKSVKTEIDVVMEKLDSPPAGCDRAALILRRLYSIYDKSYALIVRSPDSPSLCKRDIAAAREEFSREISDLKVNLPVPLALELRKAGQKYNLRFMGLET